MSAMNQENTQNHKGNQKSKDKKRERFIEDLKMEIASELGLVNEIRDKGWHSLSPRDSGRIGGIVAQRLKKLQK